MRNEALIRSSFLAACAGELSALKPGNVHIYSDGHGMAVAQFEQAAAAAAPFIADPALTVGQRIRRATEASFAAAGCNTNLGIVLLCAPLAKAALETTAEMGLRRRLAIVLSMLDLADARDAFAAIRLANPGGLGKAGQGDVHKAPDLTLIEAMHLAADRDRIANAYVTAYSDVFDFGLPALAAARHAGGTAALAVSRLHVAFMAEFPDTHIARKFGNAAAERVRSSAVDRRSALKRGDESGAMSILADFDRELKASGLNPGTTADFVVATLFADRLSGFRAKPSAA